MAQENSAIKNSLLMAVQNQNTEEGSEQINMAYYIYSMINFQNMMSLQLLQRQDLISNYMTQNIKQQNLDNLISLYPKQLKQEELTKHCLITKSIIKAEVKLESVQPDQNRPPVFTDKTKTISKIRSVKRNRNYEDDSQYQPEKERSYQEKSKKASQSKNVVKNFSKAIILFIKREQSITRKLLSRYEVDYNQFMKSTMQMKGRINSIMQMKSMWLNQQNKYAGIYRILSNLYIRKFSIDHIFNSRVQNHLKHLKYRQKISQVLDNPSQFTRMKDY